MEEMPMLNLKHVLQKIKIRQIEENQTKTGVGEWT